MAVSHLFRVREILKDRLQTDHLFGHGWQWLAIAGLGRPRPAMANHGCPWPVRAGHGKPWLAVASQVRPWPAQGRPCPARAGPDGRFSPKTTSSQKRSHRNSGQNRPIERSTAPTGTIFVTISVFMSQGTKLEPNLSASNYASEFFFGSGVIWCGFNSANKRESPI